MVYDIYLQLALQSFCELLRRKEKIKKQSGTFPEPFLDPSWDFHKGFLISYKNKDELSEYVFCQSVILSSENFTFIEFTVFSELSININGVEI